MALFALCVLMLCAASAWAVATSTEKAFIRPRDSAGTICGQGRAKNHPFLYLQNFSAPYRSVCVKSCPSFNYAHLLARDEAGRKAAAGKPMRFAEFARKYAARSYTVADVLTEAEALEYPRHWANGKFAEEHWAGYLQNFAVDCLANAQMPACRHGPGFAVYDSYAAVRKVCVPVSPKAALLFNKVSARFDLGLAEDLRLALPLLGRAAGFALALGAALFLAMLYLPRHAAPLATGLAAAGLIGTAVAIFHGVFAPGALNDTWNPLRVKYLQFWLDKKLPMLALGLAAVLAAVMTGLRAWRLREFLATPSHMIRLTARQTLRTPLVIGLTVATLLAQLLLFLGGLHVLAKLCTAGKAPVYAAGAPFAMPKPSWALKALTVVYTGGLLWVMGTLGALNDFCTEAVSVNYYFNAAIHPIHMLCHTIGHHIGSLALLAALAPLAWLRGALISAGAALPVSAGFTLGQSPAGRLYDRLIGGVGPRSLVGVYMGSLNFCRAASVLHAREKLFGANVGPLLSAGDLLSGATRVAAATLTGLFGYALYKGSVAYQQNINSLCTVWAAAALAGYFLAAALAGLCCRTLDATYGCYLVQLELSRQGYNFAPGPRELQEALGELGAVVKGPRRPLT